MNRLRLISVMAYISAATLVLGACPASGAPARDVLQIGLSTRAQPFDPAVAGGVEQTAPVTLAYEHLVTYDGRPALARSWSTSKDGLVWTFNLAHGHRFDDGREVDAGAVKFSLDRLVALGREPASDAIDFIDHVDARDSWSVRITLKRTTPRLLSILADRGVSIIDPIVATHAVNGDWGSGWLGSRTAGSGPYRLRATTQGGGAFILDRNPYWPGPRPYFSELIYRVIGDPSVRALAVAQGNVDIAFLMPAETLKRLAGNSDVRVVAKPALAFQSLAFNMDGAVFRDPKLRRAVAEALDTDAIIRYVRDGHATRFQGPLPQGMADADPALYPIHFNPTDAIRLARAARGGLTQVLLVYPGVSPETDTVAQYIQASLAPLGLRVRLERLSIPAYLDRLARGSYDLALVGLVPSYADPSAILAAWFDSSNIGGDNAARYRNPNVDRLIRAAQSELDPGRRAIIDREIIIQVNRDLPYVYLQQTEVANVVRRDIAGYDMDPVHALELPILAMSRRP